MIYTILIDQRFCIEYKLNLQQGAIYKFCYDLSTWAESIQYLGNTWYFASRNKVVDELSLVTDKPDTVYRIYKQLTEKGVIFWTKNGGKDYIRLEKNIAKNWNRKNFRVEKESEKNPKKAENLGKKSESSSEKNPTDKSTIPLLDYQDNKNTKDVPTKNNPSKFKPQSIHNPPFLKKEKHSEQRKSAEAAAATPTNVILLFKLLSGKSQVRPWIDSNIKYAKSILKCADNDMNLIEGVFKMKIFEWKDNTFMREYIQLSTLASVKNFDNYVEKYLEMEVNPIAKEQFIEKVNMENSKFVNKESQPLPTDPTFNKALTLFEATISKKTDIPLAYNEYKKLKTEMEAQKSHIPNFNFEKRFFGIVDKYTKNVREGYYSKEFSPAFHNLIIKKTWLNPPLP